MSVNSRRQHGIAMMLAIALMSISVATLAVITDLVQLQHQRIDRVKVGGQIRQLLHAGAVAARARLGNGTLEDNPRRLTLPEPLTTRHAKVILKPGDEPSPDTNERHVTVVATHANHRAKQRVTFTRSEGGWSITDAKLIVPPSRPKARARP